MLEESVLKKIGQLRQEYKEKEKAFKTEQIKLQESVDKYLDKKGVRNDLKRLEKIVLILPNCLIRDNLIRCLHELRSKEKECETEQKEGQGTAAAKSSMQTDVLSCGDVSHSKKMALENDAIKEIKRLVSLYQKKEREFNLSKKNLEKYVEGFLDKINAWNDVEKLDEVINVLPGSMLRFWLIDRKLFLQENSEKQQCVKEATGLEEEVDEYQVSDNSQNIDIGGIKL